MRSLNERCGWMGTLVAALIVLVSAACTTTTVVATAPPPPSSEDEDFSQLIAQLRADLNRHKSRVAERPSQPVPADKKQRDREFASRASALFAPLKGQSLYLPVVGVQPYNLSDSWGDPRDGGRRKHRGIDIFAPKGTPVVAVADGFISFIGDQPKGGHCIWLTTDAGASFYYAHLDRWAPGLFEGLEVRTGDLLGYVGNTGNAKSTPSHLHFGINENDEMVNPFPILRKAAVVKQARLAAQSGNAMGTR